METFEQFYKEQPPMLFVDLLKDPLHKEKPYWFNRKTKADNEVCVNGLYIENNFCDTENLLDTAIADFKLFSEIYEISGTTYPIILEYAKTDVFEKYTISVQNDRTIISAGDTEGIRRGIIYLEDELNRREGAFLPLGEIIRTPRVKARITRGFFSPTNRPPKNIDELFDDVDYYPEEYLNRLAHDGTNGLWIYTRLSDLVKTDIIPEYGHGSEKRIAKLKKIIARCKRYGVKVYIFFIEPLYLTGDIAKKHPDICGFGTWEGYTFCTHSEKGARYCVEAMEKLCLMLPDIGGFIDITNGEKTTSCASGDPKNCPRCKKYTAAEIVAYTTDLLKEGIRRAGTGADFISWTYGHRFWSLDDIKEYVKHIPDDVIVMENLEDMGVFNQLGKDHLAVDYWLSYVGPSTLYNTAADTAKEYKKHMYAKMQVCSSHEIATVPYIPVPGILFEKFSANVEGVMECWYFGNYPSLMSKAAGELSFLHDFSDKEKFLKHLAGIYFGNSRAEDGMRAWHYFEEGYKNYPVNIMFSYYGPMHDGVVWELQLEPKNQPLPRTWLYQDPANGDRIYECLQLGHTLDEVITLLSAMKESWAEGLKFLPKECPDEQKTVIDALFNLIKSGNNIVNFYAMREKLANKPVNSEELLNKMEDIVKEEMKISTQMIDVCIADARLGYHSEAESYKFFPEQLKKRIGALQTLLETEFVTVKERIKNDEMPIIFKEFDVVTYKMADSLENATKEFFGKTNAYFKAAYDDTNLYLEFEGMKGEKFVTMFETSNGRYSEDVTFVNGEKSLQNLYLGLPHNALDELLDNYSFKFTTGEKDNYKVVINRIKLGWTENVPLSFRLISTYDSIDEPCGFILNLWADMENPFDKHRLGIYYDPKQFGKLIP